MRPFIYVSILLLGFSALAFHVFLFLDAGPGLSVGMALFLSGIVFIGGFIGSTAFRSDELLGSLFSHGSKLVMTLTISSGVKLSHASLFGRDWWLVCLIMLAIMAALLSLDVVIKFRDVHQDRQSLDDFRVSWMSCVYVVECAAILFMTHLHESFPIVSMISPLVGLLAILFISAATSRSHTALNTSTRL